MSESTNGRGLGAWVVAAALVVVGMSAISGCGRKPVLRMNGVTVYERIWDKTVQRLAPQASAELQCHQLDLTYALFRKRGRHPTQIGVKGCGQTVVYHRRGRRGWVMVAEMTGGQPPAPQPYDRGADNRPQPQQTVPPHDHPHTHEEPEPYQQQPLPPAANYPGT